MFILMQLNKNIKYYQELDLCLLTLVSRKNYLKVSFNLLKVSYVSDEN